jgi:hypothetical protein
LGWEESDGNIVLFTRYDWRGYAQGCSVQPA